jgi:eukaryotic-like serine/threonine-protein kinase
MADFMFSAMTSLAGRYRLDRRIDTGGYAEVWRAEDTVLARPVAVKILRPEVAAEPGVLDRFRHQALCAASLVHESVTKIFDYEECTDGHPPFVVMELVDGPSLAGILAGGSLEPLRTLDIIAWTAVGLDAVHRAGLIHGGISPHTILLSRDGLVKLAGFGISRAFGTAPLAAPSTLLGSGYLAPERLHTDESTVASDLYGLGMVGYECLAGVLPFTVPVAGPQRAYPLPPLPLTVPAEVAGLISELTASDPGRRPRSAVEVAVKAAGLRDRMSGLAGRIPAQARPAGVPGRARRSHRRSAGEVTRPMPVVTPAPCSPCELSGL